MSSLSSTRGRCTRRIIREPGRLIAWLPIHPMAERKSILLRISPELWEELQRMASDELRSINGQIEFLLREAVKQKRNREVLASEDET